MQLLISMLEITFFLIIIINILIPLYKKNEHL